MGNIMQKFLMVAALAAVMPLSSAALADDDRNGWYGGLSIGASVVPDIETFNLINPAAEEELEVNTGYAIIGSIGHRYNANLRTEVEAGWRSFNADTLKDNAGGFGPYSMDGTVQVQNLGVNGYYDFNMDSWITPYIGIGIGGEHAKANVHRSGASASNKWDGQDWAFYYQGMLGVTVPVQDRSEMFFEYRYTASEGLDIQSNFGAFTPDANQNELKLHTLSIGARYRF